MKITRIIARETGCAEQHKPIMIELRPRDLILWLKGTRKKFSVSYSGIYWMAAKAEADRARAEKRRRTA